MPMPSPVMPNRRLDTRAAAAYLGLRPKSLERYRVTGIPHIPYLKLGAGKGRIYYRIEDLDAYVESCVRRSTSQRGPR